jgi:alkanesulfonate monooxygenase SsuD/methylene tetrahydromethanopterin reductase-like flavin-dependent oxidoreductase (luciferase family)
MQDEINEKTCNLAVRVGNTTAAELRRALEKVMADLKQKRQQGAKTPVPQKEPTAPQTPQEPKPPELKSGRQTLKQLHKHNDGLSSIALTDPNLRQLRSFMKRYDIDFATVKDGKGKYTLFFKGKNAEEMERAFKGYTEKVVKKAEKKAIKAELKEAKAEAKKRDKGRSKEKNKSKGARDR